MVKLTQMPLDNERSGDKDGQGRRRIHLREISGDSETPMETVGRDLRAARLRRGDEIAQVSRALKIRKDHLEALEEDRLEDLPGKTYAIGFVRSYARHLGLDTDQYVERFKQEISGRGDEHSREPAPIHQEEGRHYLPYGWRIIAGIVILLLGYGAWHLMAPSGDSSQQVPPPPVLNPPKPKPKPAPQPVVAPAQTATPSPATDAVPPAPAASAPGQQAVRHPAARGRRQDARHQHHPDGRAADDTDRCAARGAGWRPGQRVPGRRSGGVQPDFWRLEHRFPGGDPRPRPGPGYRERARTVPCCSIVTCRPATAIGRPMNRA